MAKKVNFVPQGDRVLVEAAEAESKTSGGIIIPDTVKEKIRLIIPSLSGDEPTLLGDDEIVNGLSDINLDDPNMNGTEDIPYEDLTNTKPTNGLGDVSLLM